MALKEKKEIALETHDLETVNQCEREMQSLAQYLLESCRPGGAPKKFNLRKHRARIAVTQAITRAIKSIRMRDPQMAEHFSKCIFTGFYLMYFDSNRRWET